MYEKDSWILFFFLIILIRAVKRFQIDLLISCDDLINRLIVLNLTALFLNIAVDVFVMEKLPDFMSRVLAYKNRPKRVRYLSSSDEEDLPTSKSAKSLESKDLAKSTSPKQSSTVISLQKEVVKSLESSSSAQESSKLESKKRSPIQRKTIIFPSSDDG